MHTLYRSIGPLIKKRKQQDNNKNRSRTKNG